MTNEKTQTAKYDRYLERILGTVTVNGLGFSSNPDVLSGVVKLTRAERATAEAIHGKEFDWKWQKAYLVKATGSEYPQLHIVKETFLATTPTTPAPLAQFTPSNAQQLEGKNLEPITTLMAYLTPVPIEDIRSSISALVQHNTGERLLGDALTYEHQLTLSKVHYMLVLPDGKVKSNVPEINGKPYKRATEHLISSLLQAQMQPK